MMSVYVKVDFEFKQTLSFSSHCFWKTIVILVPKELLLVFDSKSNALLFFFLTANWCLLTRLVEFGTFCSLELILNIASNLSEFDFRC